MMDICRLRKALMRYEGTKKRGDRHILYKDSVGIMTIGYGRNIEERGISNDEASMLLRNDIDDSVKDMLKVFPWIEELDDIRSEVVANMVFNLGIGRFSRFVKTIKLIKSGEYVKASVEMLDSLWSKQVGYRAKELSMMMATGRATNETR